MELRVVKAAGLRELAKTFRFRAAEAEPGIYRELMLQSAAELEARAGELDCAGRTGGKHAGDFVLTDADIDSETDSRVI